MFRLSIILFTLCLYGLCLGQKKEVKPITDYIPTENTAANKDDSKGTRPNQKNYSLIYVTKADKILYGNPCALRETQRMGFEYIVEPKLPYGNSKTSFGRFLNNLGVKSKLVLTRSPFWKLILNKRFDKCRTKSGDLVG